VDNLGNDLKLTLNGNGRRKSLLPKEEVKNCIARFSVWLTSGGGKISLTKKYPRGELHNHFQTSLQEKNSLSKKKFPWKKFPCKFSSMGVCGGEKVSSFRWRWSCLL